MPGLRGRLIATFAATLLCAAAGAQTSRPAVVQGRFEQEPIMGGAAASDTKPGNLPAPMDFSAAPELDPKRVALALAMVIGLILAMRWAGKKFFPSAAAPRSCGAMKVLSRLVISPKQQLLMVQVGQRIVVVGDSGGQMGAVTEITDHEEVAAMFMQLSEEKATPSLKRFGSLFNRAEAEFNEKNAAEIDKPQIREVPPPTDPAVDEARGEIDDLADKVRLLSAQFRQ